MPEDESSNLMNLIMNVSHEKGTCFLAKNSIGSRIDMDSEMLHPIEYLIASLGGCTGITIITGFKEKGINPDSFKIKVEGSRRKTPPTIFEKIHVTFTLSGDMDDQSVAEIIKDTMTLKCPIAVTLGRVGTMTWEHHIVNAEANLQNRLV